MLQKHFTYADALHRLKIEAKLLTIAMQEFAVPLRQLAADQIEHDFNTRALYNERMARRVPRHKPRRINGRLTPLR